MIGLPENDPATSLSRNGGGNDAHKNQTPPTPKVEDSVVEVGGGFASRLYFDDMSWPDPSDPNEVQWRLRHGTPTRADILFAASCMGAYLQLVQDPQRIRNSKITAIRRTMAENHAKRAANTNTSEKS